MSLITRCPACQTMFKVVPDQLRISEGWVRCGQCAEIFNAAQTMVVTDNAQHPQPSDAPGTPPAPADPLPPETLQHPSGELPAGKPAEDPVVATDNAQQAADPAPFEPAPVRDSFAVREPAWHEPPALSSEPEPLVQAAPLRSAVLDEPAAPTDVSYPSFLRRDETRSFWQRKSVRWVLLVLALGLAVALALQVILQERNRIAQLEPATRGLLVALCAVARCDIGPPQQIDSIVIDGSSFGRVRGDSYRLGFSLRNTATIDVAMPAIELSLTDTQDQTLVRRVILPPEFGAPTPALAAGADWSANLSLAVRAAPNTERIAGYRLLAFYP